MPHQRVVCERKHDRRLLKGCASMPWAISMAALPNWTLLLAKIMEDAAGFEGERQLVFLGDYVDRGPIPKACIDRLWRRRKASSRITSSAITTRRSWISWKIHPFSATGAISADAKR